MKFKINNQEELSKKLTLNLKATASNSVVQSFKKLKITVKGDKLEILSYNGNNCIISTVSIDNQEDETTSFLVDGTTFKSVIDKFIEFKSSYINVEIDDKLGRMSLNFNGIKFNLQVLKNVSDFNSAPSLDTYTEYKTAVFSKNKIRRAFSNTQKCTSKDPAKPILECVHIIINDSVAEILSLDGYRLAVNTIECECDDNLRISLNASKSMPIFTDILKSGYDYIELNSNGTYTMVENDDTVIFLKQVAFDIPNYKAFLKESDSVTKISLNKKTLENAITATKIGNTSNSPVEITISPANDSIIVKSNGSYTSGDNVEQCEIPINATIESPVNEDLLIAFNGVYILELLSSVYTETCNLTMQSPETPFFIRNDNDNSAVYMLLPIRLRR